MPSGSASPLFVNTASTQQTNKASFNHNVLKSTREILGLIGPTVLEGVLLHSLYMKEMTNKMNDDLVAEAQAGQFQAIMSFTLPAEIFHQHAGTLGAAKTENDSNVKVYMSLDNREKNVTAAPISPSDAIKLLKLFIMLPLAPLHLFDQALHPFHGWTGDPITKLKHLHDTIFSEWNDPSRDDDRGASWISNASRPVKLNFTKPGYGGNSGSDGSPTQRPDQFNLNESNGAAPFNAIHDENTNDGLNAPRPSHQQPKDENSILSCNYQWWPLFIENILADDKPIESDGDHHTNTAALRFWLFVPMNTDMGPCKALQTILKDINERNKTIQTAFELGNNLTGRGSSTRNKKQRNPETGELPGNNKKRRNTKKGGGGNNRNSDPVVTDEDVSNASTSSSTLHRSTSNLDVGSEEGDETSADGGVAAQQPNMSHIYKRNWEKPLLEIINLDKLFSLRHSIINRGDCLQFKPSSILRRDGETINTTTTTTTTTTTSVKGKEKVGFVKDGDGDDKKKNKFQSIYGDDTDSTKETSSDILIDANNNASHPSRHIHSIQDVFHSLDVERDRRNRDADTNNLFNSRDIAFEKTGYSNYIFLDDEFDFSVSNYTNHHHHHNNNTGRNVAYNRRAHNIFNLVDGREDCNLVSNPTNIFSVSTSMTSWTPAIADDRQRNYRNYFNLFDNKSNTTQSNEEEEELDLLLLDKLYDGGDEDAVDRNLPRRSPPVPLHIDINWIYDYITRKAPNITGWPSYSAALGYAIRTELTLAHSNSGMMISYTPENHSTFEARHFKGFPFPERVTCLSPIISTPYTVDILPTPYFVKQFPFFSEASEALSKKHIYLRDNKVNAFRAFCYGRETGSRIPPDTMTSFEKPRIALQFIYGMSANTLKDCSIWANKDPEKISSNPIDDAGENASSCKTNPSTAFNPVYEIISSKNLGVVLQHTKELLFLRIIELANCKSHWPILYTTPTSSANLLAARGFLVTGTLPNMPAYPIFSNGPQVGRLGRDTTPNTTETREQLYRKWNIFLHLRWFSEQMDSLKGHLFSTLVRQQQNPQKNGTPLDEKRRVLLIEINKILDKWSADKLKEAGNFRFTGVIHSPTNTYPMTPVMKTMTRTFNTKKNNPDACWPYFCSNAYGNLCIAGEHAVWFITSCTELFQLHANITQAIILRKATFASLQWSPSKTRQFPNILIPGPGATGKSFVMELTKLACVPDTVTSLSSWTPKAFNINGTSDDTTWTCQETSKSMLGDGGGPTHNDMVSILKERLETGEITTFVYDNGDDAKSSGPGGRTSATIVHSIQGGNILASNERLEGIDPALLSRFLVLVIGYVNEKGMPSGTTIQDRALQGARDAEAHAIIAANAGSLHLQHLYVALVEKMIQSNVLPDVNVRHAIDFAAVVLRNLKNKLGQTIPTRLLGHFRWLLRTTVISQAVYNVHVQGLVDKYRYNAKIGKENAYDINLLIREIPKYLFASKRTVIEVLTLMLEQFDNPRRTDLMRIFAKEAYPNGDLNKAKFWYRKVPKVGGGGSGGGGNNNSNHGGNSTTTNSGAEHQTYAVDMNYIIVRAPVTTYDAFMDWIGDKLPGAKLKKQQLAVEINVLKSNMIVITPQNDQNIHGIPKLCIKEKVSATPVTSKEGEGSITSVPSTNSTSTAHHIKSTPPIVIDGTKPSSLSSQQYNNSKESNAISNPVDLGVGDRVMNKGLMLFQIQQGSGGTGKGSTGDGESRKRKRDAFNDVASTTEKKNTKRRKTRTEPQKSDFQEFVSYANISDNVKTCDGVLSETESPMIYVSKDDAGWFVALYEPNLRQFLEFDASSDVESPLINSLYKRLSTLGLERYPKEALDSLEVLCKGKSPIENVSFRKWLGLDRGGSDGNGATALPEMDSDEELDEEHPPYNGEEEEDTDDSAQQQPSFEYLIFSNNTQDILHKIRQRLMPNLSQSLKAHKFLRTLKVKRDPKSILKLSNFTGPSEAVSEIVKNPETNPLVEMSRADKTKSLEYDLDWYAYKENCERFGVSPLDRNWLVALPTFTKLIATQVPYAIEQWSDESDKKDNESKQGDYNYKKTYPETPMVAFCKMVLNAIQEESDNRRDVLNGGGGGGDDVHGNNNRNDDISRTTTKTSPLPVDLKRR